MTQLMLPENYHKDYKMFVFHSMIEVENVIVNLSYFQNGLCCFIDEKAQFGIYNVRKHVLMQPKEKVINSHTNLVSLKLLEEGISVENSQIQEKIAENLKSKSNKRSRKSKNYYKEDEAEDNGLNRISKLITQEFDLADEDFDSESGEFSINSEGDQHVEI
jgi:hypothetical protein